jgi:hypothetical protein
MEHVWGVEKLVELLPNLEASKRGSYKKRAIVK